MRNIIDLIQFFFCNIKSVVSSGIYYNIILYDLYIKKTTHAIFIYVVMRSLLKKKMIYTIIYNMVCQRGWRKYCYALYSFCRTNGVRLMRNQNRVSFSLSHIILLIYRRYVSRAKIKVPYAFIFSRHIYREIYFIMINSVPWNFQWERCNVKYLNSNYE